MASYKNQKFELPHLFELLAINIRNNDQIRGIKVHRNEIKVVIFADDTTTFVCDTVSFSHLINTVEQFTSYSALKMNHEKTEVMPLGNMTLEPTEYLDKLHYPEKQILSVSMQTKQNCLIYSAFNRKN